VCAKDENENFSSVLCRFFYIYIPKRMLRKNEPNFKHLFPGIRKEFSTFELWHEVTVKAKRNKQNYSLNMVIEIYSTFYFSSIEHLVQLLPNNNLITIFISIPFFYESPAERSLLERKRPIRMEGIKIFSSLGKHNIT
jgi:hypothetical protein